MVAESSRLNRASGSFLFLPDECSPEVHVLPLDTGLMCQRRPQPPPKDSPQDEHIPARMAPWELGARAQRCGEMEAASEEVGPENAVQAGWPQRQWAVPVPR